MSMKKRVKQLIRTFDLFSHPVSFRYNDQPSFQSVTGGLISILVLSAFIGIFFRTLSNMVNKQQIRFKTILSNSQEPTNFKTTLDINFMFAVGLSGINLNSGDRYFDVYLQSRQYNTTHRLKSYLPLGPCNQTVWQNLGYVTAYNSLGFTSWLCPSKNLTMQLQGKYTSEHFKFYKIAVKKCDPTLDHLRPCVADSLIQTFLDNQQAFTFNFYYLNTIINPGQKQYVKTYLQDTNYFPFSRTAGVNANLFISTYTITTDESLTPVQELRKQVGGIVMNSAQMLNYQVRQTQYLKMYLRKSPITIDVQREFLKIDDTLSYIGGLFSAIIAMLGVFNLYDQFSYELEIAKNVYYYEKNDPLDSDDFNLITYFGYLIFMGFDKFGIQLKWPKMQKYHRFLEEVRKQMDMRLIMKKILYSERLGLAVLDTHKYKALHMQEPLTLDEAQVIRKDHRFYKNFRKKYCPNNQLYGDIQMTSKQLFPSKSSKQITQQPQQKSNSNIFPTQQIFLPDNKHQNIFRQVSFFSSNQINVEQEQIPDEKMVEKKQNSKVNPVQIRLQDQFIDLDQQMKIYMLKLKAESQKNNPIAKRIYKKVDDRVKKKYLYADKQNFFNKNAKKKLQDLILQDSQQDRQD